MERNIVLNIPHASRAIPVNTWQGDIQKYVDIWTDAHTDVLFSADTESHVFKAVFPYSRFFCDVNRLVDDPLNHQGQGIFYTRFDECTRPEDEELIHRCYAIRQAWLDFLSTLLQPGSILLDCHSFSTFVAPDVDICIGFNDDWSKPSDHQLQTVIQYFQSCGYRVGVNHPYSNAITPKPSRDYCSIMIGVNKALYLRPNGTLRPDAYKFHSKLLTLYKTLLHTQSL